MLTRLANIRAGKHGLIFGEEGRRSVFWGIGKTQKRTAGTIAKT